MIKFRNWLWLGCGLLVLNWGCRSYSPPPVPPPGYPPPYQVFGKWYQPLPSAKDYREQGIASWYGADFHGRKTSNGEIYDMYAMTAAHKTLPLGTFVQVRNETNQKEITVRINDRGPFVAGRIIDLSFTAAKELDIAEPGTAPVQVTALGTPAPDSTPGAPVYVPGDYYSGNFTFQVGAFKDLANAERLRSQLAKTYPNAHIFKWDNGREIFYRVRVGRYQTLAQITADEQILARDGYAGAFIVAE